MAIVTRLKPCLLTAALKLKLMSPDATMVDSRNDLLLPQVASALKRIHDLGMVHLDIKPDNIYIASSGAGPCSSSSAPSSGCAGTVYKLGDFGLAMAQGGQRAGTSEGDSK